MRNHLMLPKNSRFENSKVKMLTFSAWTSSQTLPLYFVSFCLEIGWLFALKWKLCVSLGYFCFSVFGVAQRQEMTWRSSMRSWCWTMTRVSTGVRGQSWRSNSSWQLRTAWRHWKTLWKVWNWNLPNWFNCCLFFRRKAVRESRRRKISID